MTSKFITPDLPLIWYSIFDQIDRISSVTDFDYVQIISAFYAMTEDQVDCNACLTGRKFGNRKNKDEMIFINRTKKGCFEIQDKIVFPTKHINYRRCIGNFKASNIDFMLSLRKVFQRGVNPFGGLLIDTPNKFVEVCNLLDNLITTKEQENK